LTACEVHRESRLYLIGLQADGDDTVFRRGRNASDFLSHLAFPRQIEIEGPIDVAERLRLSRDPWQPISCCSGSDLPARHSEAIQVPEAFLPRRHTEEACVAARRRFPGARLRAIFL